MMMDLDPESAKQLALAGGIVIGMILVWAGNIAKQESLDKLATREDFAKGHQDILDAIEEMKR